MGLIDDLVLGPVGIDTVAFIYFIEEHPTFLPVILPVFREADAGKREVVTSALTLPVVELSVNAGAMAPYFFCVHSGQPSRYTFAFL